MPIKNKSDKLNTSMHMTNDIIELPPKPNPTINQLMRKNQKHGATETNKLPNV